MFEDFSWKKIFRFPGPKEFGMSKHNHSMPIRDFPPHDGRPCWEDYEDKLQELYPVRFFFAYTARNFFRYKCWFPMTRPIKNSYYWLQCHMLPSYRFHMLDLRQPKSTISSIDNYRYGFREVADRMLLANFSLLNEFIEKSAPHCPTEADIANTPVEAGRNHLIRQKDSYLEMMAIYTWWNIERKVAAKEIVEMRDSWWNFHKTEPSSDKTEMAHKYLLAIEERFTSKEDEMLIRLMKIRQSFWT